MAANNLEEDEFDQDYDNENNDDLTNEEDIIRFYFYRGFNYEEILKFLQKYHDKEMSLSTLKRIRNYGLQRRNIEYDLDVVRDAVRSLLNGPGCCRGYRAIWHTLQMNGMTVPRASLQSVSLARPRAISRCNFGAPDLNVPRGLPLQGALDMTGS